MGCTDTRSIAHIRVIFKPPIPATTTANAQRVGLFFKFIEVFIGAAAFIFCAGTAFYGFQRKTAQWRALRKKQALETRIARHAQDGMRDLIDGKELDEVVLF